jgi:hypothetical protein
MRDGGQQNGSIQAPVKNCSFDAETTTQRLSIGYLTFVAERASTGCRRFSPPARRAVETLAAWTGGEPSESQLPLWTGLGPRPSLKQSGC